MAFAASAKAFRLDCAVPRTDGRASLVRPIRPLCEARNGESKRIPAGVYESCSRRPFKRAGSGDYGDVVMMMMMIVALSRRDSSKGAATGCDGQGGDRAHIFAQGAAYTPQPLIMVPVEPRLPQMRAGGVRVSIS